MQWLDGWLARRTWELGEIARSHAMSCVVAAILGIHAAVEMAGGVQAMADWYLTLGLRRWDVLHGAVWQIATHAFLHGGWVHVGANALCLVLLGTRVEQMLGSKGFLKTLAWSILGGAIGHLLLGGSGKTVAPLVGISGACMGFLLVITTLSPESRMWPLVVSGRNLGRGFLAAELIFALINPQLHLPGLEKIGQHLVANGWESWFTVGHACHLGGGTAGWLCARFVLRPRVTLAQLQAARRRRERHHPSASLSAPARDRHQALHPVPAPRAPAVPKAQEPTPHPRVAEAPDSPAAAPTAPPPRAEPQTGHGAR